MSQARNFKSDVFVHLARIAHALSTPGRLALIELVAQGERGVDELARMTGMSVANTSKHLAELRQAGLLHARKEGLRVFHRLAGPDVVALISALRHIAEDRNAEVNHLIRTFVTSRDELEPIPAAELLERVRAGLVTVLDVRPPEEFAAGHLPGAINMPPDRLAECIDQLAQCAHGDRGREIVAYCRGPYCLFSVEAVERLREKGCCARRLEDGFPEWKAAGLPVEV
ncbi:MAG: metalloregulator ArsR/SmtB family transcription factor [Candidatus Nitricoxidivorans perseverans]|uniref:Metalloregulator ArsR/SmtB family transcription factor n=1 Tax=Candidatus Nitricoxidivorans perseverans TaxID=2975601 RepID=A0AA49FN76_9PROT|nr:MAG: metalloregulator ArsR/SmtB family transcription factor [Candidatus Nitricoxidivorans perseverans]